MSARQKERARLGLANFTHGASGYTNYGCRCDECKAGHAVAVARRRRERYAQTQRRGLPKTVSHGLSAYNNHGCRCPTCRADLAQSARELRRRAS